MIEKLDEILLSENVVKNFYESLKDKKFKNWILQILPEVEDCKNLNQDNPWHIYNCLDHILHSVEEINRMSQDLSKETRRLLAYTMFFHDIGKPSCHLRRYSKKYGREIDSFFNHNIASKKIAGRVAKSFGFSKKEQAQIEMLIELHDIFMFITLHDDGNRFHHVLTPEYLNSEISKLDAVGDGKSLMKLLVMVGIADNKAQNPQMTKSSLHTLDVINEMLQQ